MYVLICIYVSMYMYICTCMHWKYKAARNIQPQYFPLYMFGYMDMPRISVSVQIYTPMWLLYVYIPYIMYMNM